MKCVITRHSRGGFSAKREDGKVLRASFDVQALINTIKSDGDTPVIESTTLEYLDKYHIKYSL